jgi:hypothetical protein
MGLTKGKHLSHWVRLAGACLASALVSQTWAQGIYTCVDRHGRRITADRPIAECSDREQRELSSTGTVRRSIGPMLSDVEREELEARKRKEAEEREKIQEQRRRERALLARYPDRASHDTERAAALEVVEELMAGADKRLAELAVQREKAQKELDVYKRNPSSAPFSLRRKLTEVEEDVKLQERFLAKQVQEKHRIQQRFNQELEQLLSLWAAQKAAEGSR